MCGNLLLHLSNSPIEPFMPLSNVPINSSLSEPPLAQMSPQAELRASQTTGVGSLAQLQTSALRELDAITNRLMFLGVQLPFLGEQIEGMLSLGQDSKTAILVTLGPDIEAEAQQSKGMGAMGGLQPSTSPSSMSPMPLGGSSY